MTMDGEPTTSRAAVDDSLFDESAADAAEADNFGGDALSNGHDRLLQNINQLDSKRAVRSIVQRSEPSAEVSQFHMDVDGGSVHVRDLLLSLGDQARHADLRKHVNASGHQRKLPPPLERTQTVKIQRKAGYEKVTKEVTRWEGVVRQQRRAEHVSFPLEKPDVRAETAAQRTAGFQPQTPLECEVAALLAGSRSVVSAGQLLSAAERSALAAVSLDEALERRRQLAKHRALLTYQECKHRRQNKIKSRKYRRVLKKERLKKHLCEFEQLKICQPEAALAKLQQLERERVEERISQRHRNTSKWARLQAIRRKYDPAAREALAENLRVGREMSQKAVAEQTPQQEDTSSEDEACAEPPAEAAPAAHPNNPWIPANAAATETEAAVSAFSGEYTRFWSEQERTKRRLREAERDEAAERGSKEEEEGRPAPQVTAAAVAAQSESSGEEEREEMDAVEVEGSEVKLQAVEVMVNKKSGVKRKVGKGVGTVVKKNALKKAGAANECETSGKLSAKKKKMKKIAKNKKKRNVDDIFDAFERKLAKKTDTKLKVHAKDTAEATNMRKKKLIDSKKMQKYKHTSPAPDAASPLPPLPTDATGKMDESLTRKSTLPELEALAAEGGSVAPTAPADQLADPVAEPPLAAAAAEPQLDPTKFMSIEPRRTVSLRPPEDSAGGEHATEDVDDARMTIMEAFADDDVIAEFREEKEATIDADKPKDVDMSLPGWGDWGGHGLKISEKKRRRLLFKAPKGPERKDHTLGHVILSERRSAGLRAHQPSELPHYISSVAAFEASIRAPVGRSWLPAAAHEQLTRPAVSRRAGTVIPPMDQATLLAGKARRRRRRLPAAAASSSASAPVTTSASPSAS